MERGNLSDLLSWSWWVGQSPFALTGYLGVLSFLFYLLTLSSVSSFIDALTT